MSIDPDPSRQPPTRQMSQQSSQRSATAFDIRHKHQPDRDIPGLPLGTDAWAACFSRARASCASRACSAAAGGWGLAAITTSPTSDSGWPVHRSMYQTDCMCLCFHRSRRSSLTARSGSFADMGDREEDEGYGVVGGCVSPTRRRPRLPV